MRRPLTIALVSLLLALYADGRVSAADSNTGPNIGQTIPDLAGVSLDGKTYDLKTYRGKILMLDFMASW